MLQALIDCLTGYFRSLVSSPEKLNDDVLEYALREHQYYSSNFDLLDSKANGIMQFVAVVLGLSAFQSSVSGNLGVLRIFALGAFALALICVIGAWCARGMDGIPKTADLRARLEDVGAEATRKELINCISKSSEDINRLIRIKAIWLKVSFLMLGIGVVLLIISIATTLPLK